MFSESWKVTMVIDELDVSAEYRLSRMVNLLERLYDITLDFATVNSQVDLTTVYEKYDAVRKKIMRESHYNTYNLNPDYNMACLIQEAICLFLSEIAPKRHNRRQDRSRLKEQP
jgi:hypothetical protein